MYKLSLSKSDSHLCSTHKSLCCSFCTKLFFDFWTKHAFACTLRHYDRFKNHLKATILLILAFSSASLPINFDLLHLFLFALVLFLCGRFDQDISQWDFCSYDLYRCLRCVYVGHLRWSSVTFSPKGNKIRFHMTKYHFDQVPRNQTFP